MYTCHKEKDNLITPYSIAVLDPSLSMTYGRFCHIPDIFIFGKAFVFEMKYREIPFHWSPYFTFHRLPIQAVKNAFFKENQTFITFGPICLFTCVVSFAVRWKNHTKYTTDCSGITNKAVRLVINQYKRMLGFRSRGRRDARRISKKDP